MTDLSTSPAPACSLSRWSGVSGFCHWCDTQITAARRTRWCTDRCRRAWERNHVWGRARAWARKRAKYACVRCGAGRDAGLEVNHIIPVNGARRNVGCFNHESNLECVCHACHVQITARQRATGLLGPGTRTAAPDQV